MRACLTREGALNTRRTSKRRALVVCAAETPANVYPPRGGLKAPDRQRGGISTRREPSTVLGVPTS